MRAVCIIAGLCCWLITSQLAHARIWTSARGGYTFDADAIAFNKTTLILKKKKGDLVAVEIAELSDADQEFLKSKELGEKLSKSIDTMQTWTSADGLKVRGRVLGFGRTELVVSRQRGKVHVGDVEFGKIDPLHQKLVLKIMSKLEDKTFESERDLSNWSTELRGQPKVYPIEGVLMELQSGDEISVPFFLFSKADLKVLQPGWKAWLEAEKDEESQQRHSLMMQTEAAEYQRNQMQRQQIELLKLNTLAVGTGIARVWEVGLQPGPGVYGRPTTMVVQARDSLTASKMASSRYPGYRVGFVRRVRP